MSGHSKWHNIAGRKGKQDKLRSNIFTKLCKAVTVAAREGGGDPDTNVSLRVAVEKAKESSVPKDNIERAIKRGTGDIKDGADIIELLYEGYAPGGVAVLVEAMTDNVTRTAGDMKHLFNKYGGSLGAPGAVQWQFVHQGVIRLEKSQRDKIQDTSDFEMKVIDAGASDMRESEFGLEIFCPIPAFQKVMEVIQSFGVTTESAGFEWIAKESIPVSSEVSEQVATFIEALDDLDDVKEVFTNEA